MEEMEKTVYVTAEEVKEGLCAVKEWLHNTLYEANRVLQENKKAVIAIGAAVAGALAVLAVVCAVLKKK